MVSESIFDILRGIGFTFVLVIKAPRSFTLYIFTFYWLVLLCFTTLVLFILFFLPLFCLFTYSCNSLPIPLSRISPTTSRLLSCGGGASSAVVSGTSSCMTLKSVLCQGFLLIRVLFWPTSLLTVYFIFFCCYLISSLSFSFLNIDNFFSLL